jgi:signal transduction histidine kinase/ligand-binding sensor domain-containing protein/ActR/RegA family two-component response regulator
MTQDMPVWECNEALHGDACRGTQGGRMLKGAWRRVVIAALKCAALSAVFASQIMAATPVSGAEQREPRFIRFGVEQGLSSTINDLAIDRQGYIWVATGDGLARYDGTNFRYWRRVVGDPDSLPDNEVTLVHVDSADRVWAATWFALSVLDADHRVPRTVRFQGDATRCGIDITAMTSTQEGVLWLGNRAGDICRIGLDMIVERLHYLVPGNSSYLGERIPLVIKALSSGDLLIGTDRGLWRADSKNKYSRVFEVHRERTGGSSVLMLSSEKGGEIWVGGEKELFLVSADGKLLPIPSLTSKMLRRAVVLRADNGYRWVGSYYGLYRIFSNTGITESGGDVFKIDSGVSRILEDHEQGLWFASYSQGLFYLSHGNEFFSRFPEDFAEKSIGIYESEIGVDSKIVILIGSDLYISDGEYSYFKKPLKLEQNLLSDRLIFTKCSGESLWFVDDAGVSILETASDNFIRRAVFFSESNKGKHESIRCVNGRLWVSMLGGGILIYSKKGKLIREFSPKETLGGAAEAFIDLIFSPDGSPWYSDGKDLRRWDGAGFVRVPLPAGEYVYGLDFASPDELWVARFGSLERYEWDGIALRLRERVTAQEGLPSVETRSVLVTSTGNIWMNTVRGLVQYDSKQRRVRVFGLRDGLPGLDFTVDVLKRKKDGPAIAVSKEGIVMFDPDQSLPAPRAAALGVETIELRRGEDTVAFSRHGNADLRAVMQPDDRDLRIVVRIMSFADPASYRYRFRLSDYDPDWVDQGSRGERIFSALSPGHYVLEVQGANADGVWSPIRRVEILVQAPWWQRWWALACYVIALATLFWWAAYLYRLRLKRRHDYQMIAQKREVAEQASQAKSRFLANLGHEVRTPMTGVLGMSELLLSTSLDTNQQGQVQSIRRAGEHLLRLVNDALDLARIEAGRLELDVVDFDLVALVDEVAALMRSLADRKGLTLRVDMTPDVQGGWHGDPTRIRQILLNLLGNAVKFTESGEVALSIEAAMPHGLRLVVSDTGPGLDAEQQQRLFRRFEQAEGARTASRYGGSGLGLAICEELALAMGGGIELHSELGEGTRFTVRLPLGRATTVSAPTHLRHQEEGMRTTCDVLLVEDDVIVADVLAGMLQALGHRVTHAGHALAALTEIATGSFDIALFDLDLPGMDGLTLARHLRAQGWRTPMIAISARADSGAEPDAKEAGFDAFLRKPLTGDALGDALHDRFAKRVETD